MHDRLRQAVARADSLGPRMLKMVLGVHVQNDDAVDSLKSQQALMQGL